MRIQTQILKIDPQQPQEAIIEQAAQAILSGELVAFPTETVYGLGANALNPQAVQRIFQAKGRPSADPLIVHIADKEELPFVAREVPQIAWKLAERFWPGPLTLVLPKAEKIAPEITAGLYTVAVRVPSHAVALALLKQSAVPIAAPSANRFGHTSPTTAQHVYDDLAGEVNLILDGGATTVGVESTVLDITQDPPKILRPGGVTLEQLRLVLGEVELNSSAPSTNTPAAMPSPGMLDKHYAPRAKLLFFTNADTAQALSEMLKIARTASEQKQRVGVMVIEEERPIFANLEVSVFSLGSGKNLEQAAARLYEGMRALDQAGVELILVRDLGEEGLGLAIRDRLKRAASQIIS
ncbi:MAG: L-threonylcarbamoyladenylate synthase [Anaerolineales bacterium]